MGFNFLSFQIHCIIGEELVVHLKLLSRLFSSLVIMIEMLIMNSVSRSRTPIHNRTFQAQQTETKSSH